MTRVILQPAAERDLIEQFVYIGESSDEDTARRFLSAAYATFDQLAEMPGMGFRRRLHASRFSNVCMWRVSGFEKHLILYSPLGENEGIKVLRVIHGSRDVERVFRG
jgi:plasmid stabilization system protein ParE